MIWVQKQIDWTHFDGEKQGPVHERWVAWPSDPQMLRPELHSQGAMIAPGGQRELHKDLLVGLVPVIFVLLCGAERNAGRGAPFPLLSAAKLVGRWGTKMKPWRRITRV